MKFIVAILFLLSFTACSSSSSSPYAPPTPPVGTLDVPTKTTDPRCSTIQVGAQEYSYCVFDPSGQLQNTQVGFPTANIVYYWHGLGGGPEEIFDAEFASLAQSFTRSPVFISLSTGP